MAAVPTPGASHCEPVPVDPPVVDPPVVVVTPGSEKPPLVFPAPLLIGLLEFEFELEGVPKQELRRNKARMRCNILKLFKIILIIVRSSVLLSINNAYHLRTY